MASTQPVTIELETGWPNAVLNEFRGQVGGQVGFSITLRLI